MSIPRRLGPYKLLAELGAGAMGTVYLARRGQERVAVKVIHPHLLRHRDVVERFEREASLGRTVEHPNVVRTHGIRTATSRHGTYRYLVMEYVEGKTLDVWAEEFGPAPEPVCSHIGQEIARGLAALHAAGAVHRDLKPDNVLITPDLRVKLTDLGAARYGDGSFTLASGGGFLGTLLYAAPEQLRGMTPDPSNDLYACGLVLYLLATGRHPFDRSNDPAAVMHAQVHEAPRPAREIRAELSPFFEAVLARLLEKDPRRRISSAQALLRVLARGETAWWRYQAARQARVRPWSPMPAVAVSA